MRKVFKVCTFIIIFSSIYMLSTSGYCEDNKEYLYYKAIITELDEEVKNDETIYKIKAKFTEGPYKYKTITLEYTPILGTSHSIELKKDMSIIVSLQIIDGDIEQAHISDVNRRDTIKTMAIVFVSVLIIFGGFKGLLSVLSLLLTFLLIIFLLIPLIINQVNPILATILVSSISILINFILINGFTKKSFCAIISTIGGTIIAGVFALYFGNLMALTGLCDDNVQTLVTHTNVIINYKGLLFSGMILGSMGAVMDIGMSITSFIFEIKEKKPNISSISLFKSGINVGKDIMSTMTNTLILAYAGASLPLFLYFSNMDASFIGVINMEFIAEEILRSISGSIGLVLTIPLTSLIASIKA